MVVIHTEMESPGSTASAQAARVFRPGRLFSHLMADTEQELRDYAKSIGLNLRWIQNSGEPTKVHFDVTGGWLTRAKNDSRVTKMTFREWMDWKLARDAKLKEAA